MAIVRKFGSPHLFLTVFENSNLAFEHTRSEMLPLHKNVVAYML